MLLFFFSLCLLPGFSVQEKTSLELMEYLFNASRHDKRIVPSVGRGLNVPVNVSIGLALQQIENLDEKRQVLVSHVVQTLEWSVQQLTWNPAKYHGIKTLKVPTKMIWMPDIILYNSLNMDQTVGMHRGHALLHHTGQIIYRFSKKIESSCKTNVANYPFDKQECTFKFGSWALNGFELDVKSRDKGGDLTGYTKSGEWEILEFTTKLNKIVYGCCPEPYYDVTYNLKIRRQVLYYAIYFIIPCALIAMLAATIFLLPQDCSERITVGMCALVGLSFFFLLVSENMPASESVPLIGGYYSVTMLQMGFSYFMNVLVLRLHHMTEEEVPSWVRKLLLGYGARLLGKKFYTKNSSETDEKQNPDPAKDAKDTFVMKVIGKKEYCREVLQEDNKIAQVVKEEHEVNKRDVEWKQAAAVLNDLGLILHIIVVLLTFMAMFFEVLFIANS
ncbi:neuronal acetylcholine receptor subunit alpha-10-like [Dendronephthya gigantea]|uniref:neuronal acetylcholine receptor subunit alpha-10-like n=1 Tax=Dendronephthya gigantea TaxID=151771 RepID=UPI00106A8142|nr:neuronal acetylcholine receptor subunit alpha-10-like [Dendronephthya gigantea]